LLREKREVSASEKKKLAPANTRTTTTAANGVAAISPAGWRKGTGKATQAREFKGKPRRRNSSPWHLGRDWRRLPHA
jgi:hypothetical protein